MGDYDCEIVGYSHQVLTKAAIVVSELLCWKVCCVKHRLSLHTNFKNKLCHLKALSKDQIGLIAKYFDRYELIPELVQGAVQPRHLAKH